MATSGRESRRLGKAGSLPGSSRRQKERVLCPRSEEVHFGDEVTGMVSLFRPISVRTEVRVAKGGPGLGWYARRH